MAAMAAAVADATDRGQGASRCLRLSAGEGMNHPVQLNTAASTCAGSSSRAT